MKARIIALTNDGNLEALFLETLEGQSLCEQLFFASSAAQIPRVVSISGMNVLLLDTETQRVTDTFLVDLKQRYKLHVIIIGHTNIANFMKHGITDIMHKPINNNPSSVSMFKKVLTTKIEAYISGRPAPGAPIGGFTPQPPPVHQSYSASTTQTVTERQKVIAMAASTGGTEALVEVLKGLPANVPPILIVQHMPAGFTKQFADRLDKLVQFKVKEAEDNEYMSKNLALIAPGNYHMRMIRKNGYLAVENVQTPHVHAVRPAADVLFQSMIPIMGGNVVGVVLTGMGNDGARGLFELKAKGARVVGQDEKTCAVYGMPKAAYDIGAVDFQVPLNQVAQTVMRLV
jgi:two-component system chemotaxis response regulator CheB